VKQPCEHQGERRRKRGSAPRAGADIPLQAIERTALEQTLSLQPKEDPMLAQVNFP